MATTSTAGLTANNDLSSELALNRIMNGQVKPSSGKGISAAGRVLSSNLDASARSMGVLAENVAVGLTYAQGVQNATTELINQVKSIGNAIVDKTLNSTTGATYKNNLDAILATTVPLPDRSNPSLFGSTGRTFTIGNVTTEQFTIKNDVNGSSTAFNTLYNKLADGSAEETDYLDAINELYATIEKQSTQYSILQNRYDMLNDLISTYKMASDDQSVTVGGSANSLVNTI